MSSEVGGIDPTVQVQYNKYPPMTNVADGDDIYIDCQPVNKFGETQVPLDPTPGDILIGLIILDQVYRAEDFCQLF